MKLLVVLSAFMVVINAFSVHESWSNFKITHSKTYQNIKEEQLRFQIFQKSLKTIEEHNAKYNNGEVSYYLAVNQFADMTSEEFMSMFNKRISNRPKFNTTLFEAGDIKVEDSMDWRDRDAVLEVKDELDCESYWAFSTIGALQSQLAIHKNQKILLSAQELVDCSKKNGGCTYGGDVLLSYEYVKEFGISSESSYNYRALYSTCKAGAPRVLETISSYELVAANENALKTAVGSVGPISVGLFVTAEWRHYGGGIYDSEHCTVSPGTNLDHAALVVGYGSDNKDYWIIQNSWGTTWGENGYIRIVRGKNQCGVSNYASFPKL